jgi:hypothetical protein
MDNLMINDNSGEFYYKDSPLLTLNNTKTINLFIGANNTRKSRLLRRIAQLERKLIIKSAANLSDLFIETKRILAILKKKNKDHPEHVLMKFQGNRHKPNSTKRFAHVQEFFQSESRPAVLYVTFISYLERILNEIPALATEKDIYALKEHIKKLYSLIDLFVYVYSISADDGDITQNNNYQLWDEHNASSIDFVIPDRDNRGKIQDLEFKLDLFLSIRILARRYTSIDAEILSNHGIYIPVLRSSRNLLNEKGELLKTPVFTSTINFQYFNSAQPPTGITVHTGQEHYELIDKAKRGKKAEREDFAEFESFIGKSFYNSSKIEIIAHNGSAHPTIIVSLPDEKPDVPIHDLGDGVQAIINLFFPIFTAANGSWIYIDEPELNLHPGFQNLFIRTLLENEFLKTKGLKYFVNSHSNHILSEVLLGGVQQSEIYVFERKNQVSTTIRTFEGYENATLDLLGVMNTSTLVSNCSVWVEGVTDRIYLRAFLTAFLHTQTESYQPIEGLNYAFIEYGGKNLVHYIFEGNNNSKGDKDGIKAFFLNRRTFLLADTDTNKELQHEGYDLLNTSHFHYRQTVLPEIENLLPKTVLALFLENKLHIKKEQVAEILKGSYEKVKLGKYFEERFTILDKPVVIAAKTGGTLSSYYKSSLAEFVLQGVQGGTITWALLEQSEYISLIITELYQFIRLSNQKDNGE